MSNEVLCDFRSDTLTKPCAGMRAAMAEAEVGDDVYGEDPTVLRLQDRLAGILGKDAALLFPSGTQSNLAALLAHCGRGEEIIVGAPYHTYVYEAAGASVLGGVALYPVPVEEGRHIAPDTVTAAVKEDDNHYAISRLLACENTVSGRVIPLDVIEASTRRARDHGLNCHLDGARFFNAVTGLGIDPAALAAPFDTVSICLSKGLGTPIGSVLVGNRDLIAKAHRLRKMLGGGMRQAGVLAAAGLYALDHNVARLAEDHARAEELAAFLRAQGATGVVQDTNMVFMAGNDPSLDDKMRRDGIEIGGPYATRRLVLHKDITEAGLVAAMQAFGRHL
ncbi:low-specificity L-threonine aldolase [Cognatishimia sp. MH4019]|uniref:low-specificity L-threonine aldolase n=1 Tax=Cognatishimia sp. MH4019 TaxID=2854030 RepID=UPI001CD50509|nr:low-specificity L-threonine aldolase [Cognatishimia sp. MH4019]